MTVATALAVSWNPLTNSNPSAIASDATSSISDPRSRDPSRMGKVMVRPSLREDWGDISITNVIKYQKKTRRGIDEDFVNWRGVDHPPGRSSARPIRSKGARSGRD